MSSASSALEAVERVLEHGGDADDVLRGVVAALCDSGFAWAGIFFVEQQELVLGPQAGRAATDGSARMNVPVTWQGDRIAELAVDGAEPGDAPMLERVATHIADYCLVGWDTGGAPWDD